MTINDATSVIEQLPTGAEFHRCAFQVNPHHYALTSQGISHGFDEETYAAELVEVAREKGITVLAVTDHNHVGGVEPIRAAAKPHGIIVFPGFELASQEGIHVLCLYPPETSDTSLSRFLGAFGVLNTEPSSDPCKRRFSDLLADVISQGGIPIAAHISEKNGLLRVLNGKPRVRAWRDENLLAVQIPHSITDLDHGDRKIVENKDPEYHRPHSPEKRLAVAVLNAKDVVKPDTLADSAASCLVKMSEVTIEGLRQAFLDPGSRIRLNVDPKPEQHSEFIAMTWQGGFLDGTAIRLNSNLNVLVGGRGTGKSTVIESLRHVLGLEPLGQEARNIHEGIMRNVVRNGTKIALIVRSHRPSLREYRIERTLPNPPVVRDNYTGDVLSVSPSAVFPDVEAYGQHEISELANSPQKLTRLLDRFIGPDDGFAGRKRGLRERLRNTRERLLAVVDQHAQTLERLEELPILEETLARYQEAGLEDDLREQSLLVREEALLDAAVERMEPFRRGTEGLAAALPIDTAFLSPAALDELPSGESLSPAREVLERLDADVTESVAALRRALVRADGAFGKIRERFEERRKVMQSAYDEKLRELQKQRIDGAEFIRLRRRIEALRPLRTQVEALKGTETNVRTERRDLLVEWEDAKAYEFRTLERAAKTVSRKLRGRVRVRVEFAGNREPLFGLLRREIGGRLLETIKILGTLKQLSLSEFANRCRAGPNELSDAFGLSGSQGERLVQASESTLMQIEELDLPHMTAIELNTAPEGQSENWQGLDQLSTGQKATAVLLLLLLECDAPLVVDQPEDDLDNRFITDGIVPRMREEKRRRQFLFSTHNANIPVLGDAELILGLSANGEANNGLACIALEHMGAIDSRPVRQLVGELLEGGEEAFERRRRKYGF